MITAAEGETVRRAVRQYVLITCLPDEPADSLRDDTPLRTSGILDSFGTMSLVSFLKAEFGVELDVYETTVDRFDTVDDVAEAVQRKLRG